jgi:hypothetical protein
VEINLELLPTHYQGWTKVALTRRDRDRQLVEGLSAVRSEFDSVIRHYDKTIEEVDGAGATEEQKRLGEYERARDYCRNVVTMVDEILKKLDTFQERPGYK